MDHDQLEENLSLYALGALDPDSVREMEQHLVAGCPACSTLLRQYQAAMTMLPYALAPQTPPPTLKTRIMTALSGRATATTSTRADEPAPSVPIPTAPPDLASPRRSSGIPQEQPASSAPTPSAPPDLQSPHAYPKIQLDLPEALAPQPLPLHDEPRTWQEQLRAMSPALAAVLGALLLGLGGYAVSVYNTLEAERRATARDRTEAAQSKQEIANLKSQLEDKQATLTRATAELKRTSDTLAAIRELLAQYQENTEALKVQLKTGRRPKDRSRTTAVQTGDDLLRILTSPTAQMASLSGTLGAKEAYAMVFVEPRMRRGFFYANNLPSLPAGKTYQLWVITEKPISAGVFTLDPGHKGRLLLRDIPDVSLIKKFAVSLEPEGGRPQPTGNIYLAGVL